MPLAPGQKSFMVARLGVARLGAFRLGYVQSWVKVVINGVDRTGNVRVTGASITDELNHEPNTVSLRCSGFTPVQGQDVKIYIGDSDLRHQEFGGVILSLSQTYEDLATNVVWDVNCIDYIWLFNAVPVLKRYTTQSATAILQDLTPAGFTSVGVVAGLPVLDEITFTNEERSTAVTRVMERIGGYWAIGYDKDVQAFLTATETAGSIVDLSQRGMSRIAQRVDLSQVATRVVARGGGSNTAAAAVVGATVLHLESAAATWYNPAGGVVECGPERLTYTGVAGVAELGSETGFVEPPPTGIVVTTDIGQGAGSMDPSASYSYALTWVTQHGESLPGPTATGTSKSNGSVYVEFIPVPTDSSITGKYLYRTDGGGGGGLRRHPAVLALAATTYTDFGPDANLTTAVPTVNTAGSTQATTPAGSTTLKVEDLAQFAASGLAFTGSQMFRYTGRSGSSGIGTLTGIPASGEGSLVSPVHAGTVRMVPHLTGIPASGAGSILYAINQGEQVNLIVTVNDTTAQTALAAYIGSGDGVREMFISDGRWGLTEATANATAELTQRKNPLITNTWDSRDPTIKSGRDITITLTNPAISGTFKVQRVTLSEIGIGGPTSRIWPLRRCEASSRRYSFTDLLRQIKGRAA